jgi:hypothetical protein
MSKLEMVLEWADDVNALKPVSMDGNTDMYDYAILGITDAGKLVYSKDSMIRILTKNSNMSYDEASEFLEHNCFSTYVGEMTPIYVNQFL